MLSVKSGQPIAGLRGGSRGDQVLGIVEVGDQDALGRDIGLRRGVFEPMLSLDQRCIEYVAGPSGAGKSSYAASLIEKHKKVNPDSAVFIFSRSPMADDPALAKFADMVTQVTLDDSLLLSPPDVTTMERGTLLVFDDVGTIFDDKLKQGVLKVIMDVAEVGRKYGVYLIVTSHLINPNDRKFSRVILNEVQYLTVFPGSGNTHSISYVLKNYFGLSTAQIRRILDSTSRWVRIHCHSPRWVLEEKAAYIL